jgi:3-hydroxyisobutyrate dehydrogenase/2-hydroxy-3-oxopropionate reductase
MGTRVALRLLDAGHDLAVWNRTAGRTGPLAERGAVAAATPAEAAKGAAAVVTMVSDGAALDAVVAGPTGIASGVEGPLALIQMSTVGPQSIGDLVAVLPDSVELLDAPVVGSLAEAESGSLTIFAGGPEELVHRCMPLLRILGTPVYVGPVGHGQAAKLVANATLLGALGVLGEALALADGLGLLRDTAFEILSSTPLAAQAERRRPAIESGDYAPRFTLSLARKDGSLIADAAAEAGIDLRLAPAWQSWLEEAERRGFGKLDYAAVLAAIAG